MGHAAVSLTVQDVLRELAGRRHECLRDYDRLYGAVSRVRRAVRIAEDQHDTITREERTEQLREAEVRLTLLEQA